MTIRFWRWIFFVFFVLSTGGGCLVSNLHNGFDLKSPTGAFFYLVLPGLQSGECAFDSGRFGSCTFGP